MKTLLERLSRENREKVLMEAYEYPNTWKPYLEELNGHFFTVLTLICCQSVYNAIYPLEPFDLGKFQDLFQDLFQEKGIAA